MLPEMDKGRFAVTNTADDSYVFRAAPLRNIALTAPYFHSGKVWDLKQALATMGTSQLGEALNDDEVDLLIVAFLNSLTGKIPDVTYPVLPPERQRRRGRSASSRRRSKAKETDVGRSIRRFSGGCSSRPIRRSG
ncbi:hypothetical protein ABID21_004918 [Pseudorhizobium tarimense]|uniref:Cytochrome c peroxidase n=1 Tax=Pseudorhizobium tarimense TaxID=1079109 RepID=A0ABV2HE05_9HYPH|nr:hypothetical protein [Pseudorhizobium tarimense]MCJ8521743.1 hypothetical protein [Pseudorhizobium tarimense]